MLPTADQTMLTLSLRKDGCADLHSTNHKEQQVLALSSTQSVEAKSPVCRAWTWVQEFRDILQSHGPIEV